MQVTHAIVVLLVIATAACTAIAVLRRIKAIGDARLSIDGNLKLGQQYLAKGRCMVAMVCAK